MYCKVTADIVACLDPACATAFSLKTAWRNTPLQHWLTQHGLALHRLLLSTQQNLPCPLVT